MIAVIEVLSYSVRTCTELLKCINTCLINSLADGLCCCCAVCKSD